MEERNLGSRLVATSLMNISKQHGRLQSTLCLASTCRAMHGADLQQVASEQARPPSIDQARPAEAEAFQGRRVGCSGWVAGWLGALGKDASEITTAHQAQERTEK